MVVTTYEFGSAGDLAAFDIDQAIADAVADQLAKLGEGASVKASAKIVLTAVYLKPDSITCAVFVTGYATASGIDATLVDGGCDARHRLGRSMLEASESSEITIKVEVSAAQKDLAVAAAGLDVDSLSAELGVTIEQIGEIGITVEITTTVEEDEDETPASSPPPPADTEEEDDDGSSGLSGGAAAGIAVAVIVVVAIGAFVIVKMRKNAEEEGFDTLGEGGATSGGRRL